MYKNKYCVCVHPHASTRYTSIASSGDPRQGLQEACGNFIREIHGHDHFHTAKDGQNMAKQYIFIELGFPSRPLFFVGFPIFTWQN